MGLPRWTTTFWCLNADMLRGDQQSLVSTEHVRFLPWGGVAYSHTLSKVHTSVEQVEYGIALLGTDPVVDFTGDVVDVSPCLVVVDGHLPGVWSRPRACVHPPAVAQSACLRDVSTRETAQRAVGGVGEARRHLGQLCRGNVLC